MTETLTHEYYQFYDVLVLLTLMLLLKVLPQTCPLQHYSETAYRSDQVTGLRQPCGGVHVSHDALCF